MADDVTVIIGADTTKAIKSITGFGKKATKSIDGIRDAVFSLKGAIAAVSAALAGRAIINGIKKVTEAASRQEDAVNSLNSALKSTGEFSEAASQDLQDYASAMQKATKFGDELIIEQLALAKAFGATNEQAKDVTTASIELAAATGKSLEEATRQVSKTLGGFAGELGEVNPLIKALTAEQLKAGEAAKILIEQYGGTATRQLNTFSGSTAQLTNTFGDLLEEVGFLITQNPIIVEGIKDLNKVFQDLIKDVSENKKEIKELVKDGLKALFAGLNRVIKAIKSSLKFISDYRTEIIDLGRSILNTAAAFVTLRIAVIAYTTASSFGALASVKDFVAAIQLMGGAALKTAIPMAVLAAKVILVTAAVVASAIAIDLLIRNFDLLGPAIVQAVNLEQITSLKKEIEETGKAIKEINEGGVGSTSGGGILGVKIQTNVKALQKRLEEARQELEDLSFTAKQTGDQLRKEFDPGPILGPLLERFGVTKDTMEQGIDVPINFIGPRNKPEGFDVKPPKVDTSALRAGSLLDPKVTAARQKAVDAEIAAINTARGQFAGSIISAFAQGAKGVQSALSASIAFAFGPAVGAVAGPLIGLLAQGPDAVTDLVNSFVEALPQILENIAQAIPALVTALAENVDEIIIALVKATPDIAVALAIELPIALATANWGAVAGNLASAFIEALTGQSGVIFDFEKLKNILNNFNGELKKIFNLVGEFFSGFFKTLLTPFDGFIKSLTSIFNQVIDSFNSIFSSSAGGKASSTFESLRERSGFANGGTVPSGFPNDSLRANLSSGELVIPKNDLEDFRRFVNGQGQISMEETNALLAKLIDVAGVTNSQEVSISQDGLSEMILQANRRNERLTA